jgi:dihydroorotase-like cyclic amidohydrolase
MSDEKAGPSCLIRGGTVVSQQTTEQFDVGIRNGRIVAFAATILRSPRRTKPGGTQ